MSRLRRVLVCTAIAVLVAALAPIYPVRNEVRNFMVGGGGDEISHHWSFHSLPGFFAQLRYETPSVLTWVGNFALFSILTASLTLATYALWDRVASTTRAIPPR